MPAMTVRVGCPAVWLSMTVNRRLVRMASAILAGLGNHFHVDAALEHVTSDARASEAKRILLRHPIGEEVGEALVSGFAADTDRRRVAQDRCGYHGLADALGVEKGRILVGNDHRVDV